MDKKSERKDFTRNRLNLYVPADLREELDRIEPYLRMKGISVSELVRPELWRLVKRISKEIS